METGNKQSIQQPFLSDIYLEALQDEIILNLVSSENAVISSTQNMRLDDILKHISAQADAIRSIYLFQENIIRGIVPAFGDIPFPGIKPTEDLVQIDLKEHGASMMVKRGSTFNQLNERINGVSLTPPSILCARIPSHQGTHVQAIQYHDQLDIGVISNARLIFMNSYSLNAPDEAIYYITNVMKRNAPADPVLYLGGHGILQGQLDRTASFFSDPELMNTRMEEKDRLSILPLYLKKCA